MSVLLNTAGRPRESEFSLQSLRRSGQQIESHLQALLDAQADGLQAGLDGDGGDQASDTSGASTGLSLHSGQAVPVRQPTTKPIGLRGARRGISRTMRQLALLKGEEMQVLSAQQQESHVAEEQVAGWQRKRGELEEAIAHIGTSEQGARSQELQGESEALQEQINELERQLLELKSKQRAVLLELSTIENAVQSKLSSYRASLTMLDKEARHFLEKPSRFKGSSEPNALFLSLPPKRRTLEMAMQHLTSMRRDLEEQHAQAEVERDALEQGLTVWQDVVDRVQTFERELREEMGQFDRASRHPDADPHTNQLTIQRRLSEMDETISYLESKLSFVEERGWKLLQCAIAAELDAFSKGRELLATVLQAAAKHPRTSTGVGAGLSGESPGAPSPGDSPIVRRVPMTISRPLPDIVDDEPDPDLLVSHHEVSDVE